MILPKELYHGWNPGLEQCMAVSPIKVSWACTALGGRSLFKTYEHSHVLSGKFAMKWGFGLPAFVPVHAALTMQLIQN